MSKVAVVFWSATGNTGAMAKAVGEAAVSKGAEVDYLGPGEFSSSKLADYDAVAFGCPAMGAEVLEESEFEPMFTACGSKLGGKNIALFGSYGWGTGEWMHSWEDQCADFGAVLVTDSVICNEAPNDDGIAACKALGAALA